MAEKARHSVAILCRCLRVSPSGFYAWRARPESQHARDDRRLKVLVHASFEGSRHRYGSPRIHEDLREQHESVSRKLIRLMQEDGLVARARKRFKHTTMSDHDQPVAANLLDRQFTATVPNARWVAEPHFGGHIERLIGRMMGAVHLLRGSTFANAVDKGDYDSEKCAVLTLAELERWLALEIAGVYHHSIHAALGTSPFAAWHEGLAKQPQPPRAPVDRQTFFLDFLPGEHRLVRRDGIQLFWLHYWDNVLSPWAGRSTKRMLVKYNPRNLSRIYVRDEHGTYWPIPTATWVSPRLVSGSNARR